mgnify:CR=1 FL=1
MRGANGSSRHAPPVSQPLLKCPRPRGPNDPTSVCWKPSRDSTCQWRDVRPGDAAHFLSVQTPSDSTPRAARAIAIAQQHSTHQESPEASHLNLYFDATEPSERRNTPQPLRLTQAESARDRKPLGGTPTGAEDEESDKTQRLPDQFRQPNPNA